MKDERKKLLAEMDELFKINLNGEWEVFKDSCKDIKEELTGMTIEQIRALKSKICIKYDAKFKAGSTGSFTTGVSEK